ncbi:MAG: flagellar motor switch protein FliN [Bryobacteraceae bacterium]
MTESQENRSWLVDAWLEKLSAAIELMTDKRPSYRRQAAPSVGCAPPDSVWYEMPFSPGSDHAILVGASESCWMDFGRFVLEAAGIPGAGAEDARGSTLEMLSQAASGLAQLMSQRTGKEVTSSSPRELLSPDPKYPADMACDAVELDRVNLPSIRLLVAPTLPLELAAAETPNSPAHSRTEQPDAPRAVTPRSKTLDLLMEVELPVSVSFGRAHLPLRDALKLNSGSIIELNRTITDPVEIIVNNCVVARGEVVVVDGNYGVRIQQVISREERLRTLN